MHESIIFIVDDESLNLLLFEKMLGDGDYEIHCFSNGKECIEKSVSTQPDLILMDWNMPGIDGIETLVELKKNKLTSEIPVIMITGIQNSSENLAYAMSKGAVDFIKKPFDKLELNARVKNILLLYSSLSALREHNQILENKNILISSLIESFPHPLIFTEVDGTLILSNKAFEDSLKTDKTIIGKSVYQLYNPEELGVQVQNDVNIAVQKLSVSYQSKAISKDKIWVVSKNLVTNTDNTPIGIITSFTDVTEMNRVNEERLNAKKLELVTLALQLTHMTEVNNSILTDLKEILPFVSDIGRIKMNEISRKYTSGMNKQIWKDFEEKFQEAFDLFYHRLLEQFPTLTPTERKLCTLLRSGMSSKEIAQLTFQNPQSVDVARYRIRKKLNLANEDNIVDFLMKLESN